MTEEELLLNNYNTLVTPSRVVIRGTTYATRNISSVRAAGVPMKLGGPLLLVLIGLVVALMGDFKDGAPSAGIIVGVGLFAAGVYSLYQRAGVTAVYVTTNAGEVRALESKDQKAMREIADAIALAIARR